MADIARRAGISTGNIYRYFPDKQALIAAALPPAFVAECRSRLRARVASAFGQRDPSADPRRDALSEAMIDWALEHRERMVILLRNPRGTPHEDFLEGTVQHLVQLAEKYARSIDAPRSTPDRRRALRLIYESLLRTFATLLAEEPVDRSFRAALDRYLVYHLHGLQGLFS